MTKNTISPLDIAKGFDSYACQSTRAGYLLVSPRAAEAVIAAFPGAHEDPTAGAEFARIHGFTRLIVPGDS